MSNVWDHYDAVTERIKRRERLANDSGQACYNVLVEGGGTGATFHVDMAVYADDWYEAVRMARRQAVSMLEGAGFTVDNGALFGVYHPKFNPKEED